MNVLAGLALLLSLPGCLVNLNRVPGDTQKFKENQTGYNYYLYVPSWHNNDQSWPIIVTCHGTPPYDSAWSQIHEWRGIAEQYGLLVIAPELQATSSGRTLDSQDQIRRQQQDEQAILNIVQKTITSLNGDPDRVFMVGWSAGGYDVYYTGLRNPQIFRALAVRMGNFDEKFLTDVTPRMDPYQSVVVFLASEDFPAINTQCRNAYKWLNDRNMKRVSIREIPGLHERKPKAAFSYFKDVAEQYSFVRLSAVKNVDGDPLTVQFYAHISPEPQTVVWDFTDHKISNEMAPKHKFPKPGTYDVNVTIITKKSAKTQRKIKLDLTDKNP